MREPLVPCRKGDLLTETAPPKKRPAEFAHRHCDLCRDGPGVLCSQVLLALGASNSTISNCRCADSGFSTTKAAQLFGRTGVDNGHQRPRPARPLPLQRRSHAYRELGIATFRKLKKKGVKSSFIYSCIKLSTQALS